jgi:hypothetical protein
VFKAFDDIGTRIEARAKSYYLLSYCSPARAGKHELRIEATIKDPKSGSEEAGNLTSEFDATGFGPGCDPRTPPSFDITKGDLLAPKPEVDKARDEKKEEKKEAPKEEPKEDKQEDKKDMRAPVRIPPPPVRPVGVRPPPPPENASPSPAQDFSP